MQLEKRFCWFICFLICLNLFIANGSISLWEEDEAAYAGFAMQMLETGDYLNPSFLWADIHRKTPFHFWTIACSYSIFGINEFATRLPSTLFVLLTLLITWRWGRLLFGEQAARWGAVILGTSIMLPIMAKIAFTDASLLFFETAAMLSLFCWMQSGRRKWNYIFWISISFGVLVKGPPILILMGGIWLWLAIFHPNKKRLLATHPWIFGPLALLPFCLWAWLSWQSDKGTLLTFLYDWYILKRIGGNIYGQTGLPGYHLLILNLAFLSWLPFFLPAISKLFQSFYYKREELAIYGLGGLVFSWLFYEVMTSKLPSYSLAAHPLIALLIGQCLVKETDMLFKKHFKIRFIIYVLIWFVLILGLPIYIYTLLGLKKAIYSLPLVIFVGGALIWTIVKFAQKSQAFICGFACIGALFIFSVWCFVMPLIEQSPIKSLKRIADAAYHLNDDDKQEERILILGGIDEKQTKISLPFYLHKYFKVIKEIKAIPEILHIYVSTEAYTFILGEKAFKALEKETKAKAMIFSYKKIDWYSTDDQLKSHPYWVVKNY